MRIIIELTSRDGMMDFPIHYNREVQGMIYHNIDRVLAERIHDEGAKVGKRSFKFFTFSRILGRFRRNGDRIAFEGSVKLHISSVHEEILQSLAEHLLRRPEVFMGKQDLQVQSIEVESLPELARPMRVRALSPITTYSTLQAGDGRKKTYYYAPAERDWEGQVLENLIRKARALKWPEAQIESLADGNAHIRPVRVSNRDQKIMKYRDTVIKGWSGIYELDLPEPFLLLAYDAGLGSKNSQGFGMVEVVG